MMLAAENAATRLWNVLRIVGWVAVPILLLAPLVAMQFTGEVNWTASDFLLAGVLLIGAGLAIELATRPFSKPAPRFAIALAVGVIVALIWAEGAVGLFH